MKNILILIAALVIGAGAVSFGVARWVAARAIQPTAALLHDPAWLRRELDLTQDQAHAVDKLEKEFRFGLRSACAAHCAARMALGDELAKPLPDVDQCRASVAKMNTVQAESEQATLAHILKVRALLTEPQAQRYSALVRDQVCNMPMGVP